MPDDNKKGITVKIDAELHAQVREYIESHGMTMAEFITLACDDELHPKNQMKENQKMENMRTVAFQVPEDLFQRIKDYMQRNNMTQRQFLLGLIETELNREQTEREAVCEAQTEDQEPDEEVSASDRESEREGFVGECDDSEEAEEYDESEDEDEAQGPVLGM